MSNNRHKYFNKVPPFKPDPEHYTRKQHSWKAKEAYEIEDSQMGVNYGLNKVRFPAPVPVGSRLRARMKLLATEPVAPNGLQMTWEVTLEREGSDKPVCVAESLVRSYGAAV